MTSPRLVYTLPPPLLFIFLPLPPLPNLPKLTSVGMVLSLNHLPEEILHSILCHSPPRSSTALEQSSSRFHDVTNEPLLWRHYCQSYYKSWDKRHDISSKLASPVSSVDWKALFVLRYRVDLSITRLLDSILASQTGRIEKFRAVIDFGYDAKDTLLRHCRVESGEDHLARRCAICANGHFVFLPC